LRYQQSVCWDLDYYSAKGDKVQLKILAFSMVVAFSGFLSGCAGQSKDMQMTSYLVQLEAWKSQQEAETRNAASKEYMRRLNNELEFKKEIAREETKRIAIEANPVFSSAPRKEGDKGQSDLRIKCVEGFNCASGDCEYPPDDLCAEAFKHDDDAGEDIARQSPPVDGQVVIIGATIENFMYMSPGATSGSDRSDRSVKNSGAGYSGTGRQPQAPPVPPKSPHEVWGGVVSSMWEDALGFGKAVAPWYFGANVLKAAITTPNTYIAAGDDLTSGGDNNTSRGDYTTSEVVFEPEEAEEVIE